MALPNVEKLLLRLTQKKRKCFERRKKNFSIEPETIEENLHDLKNSKVLKNGREIIVR